MADLQTIKAPIKAEMDEFQPFFRNFLRSGTRLLDLLLFYVQKQKGKQIRPMLVFLTAKLYGTVKTQQGLTLIPLSVYLDENGRCKVELGLCRGKKNYDKRESEAKRAAERKMDKAIKASRNR